MKFSKALLAIIITSMFFLQATAQDWEVPESESAVVSSVPFSSKTAQQGKDLFNMHCKSCHGAVGANASLPLNPEPGDFATERFSKQSDGSLFYKMSKGRAGMPGFESQLAETDRWSIISYIRTFHPDYKPANASTEVVETPAFEGENITLEVVFSKEDHEAIVKVFGDVNGEQVKAQGIRVGVYAKRYFGYLPMGDVTSSDENGLAVVKLYNDLPGDSLGNVDMMVKLIDDDVYGKVEYKETVALGEPFVFDNPLNYRTLWGTMANVPLWLLFSYLGVVGLVWIVIAWVVLQMLRLKKLQ
jgi:mono/diheme cytochrome c family protein